MTAPPARRLVVALATLLLAMSVVACGGSQASALVTYQRAWPDGFHEELTVLDDGKVTMRHGDDLERLTLTGDQVRTLRDSLAAGLTMGDQGDALVRTVVLGNGTSHSPVRVEPGSAVEMLEVLMTTHSLGGIQAEGVSPPPQRSMDH
ncbi:MAG: hypothetical protein ABWZ82_07495 [Candidatus Limnocylindrales bacterium]